MCNCLEFVVKLEENPTLPSGYLIKCRNYFNTSNKVYLKNPTDFYLEITTLHVTIFAKYFLNNIHSTNLLYTIFTKCVNETNRDERYASWFTGKCKEHKEKALKILILVLIRKNCIWQLEKINKTKKNLINKRMSSRTNESARIPTENRRLRILKE